MMSEMMRESLSALLDDEANELEVERVLAKIAGDPGCARHGCATTWPARCLAAAPATCSWMSARVREAYRRAGSDRRRPQAAFAQAWPVWR